MPSHASGHQRKSHRHSPLGRGRACSFSPEGMRGMGAAHAMPRHGADGRCRIMTGAVVSMAVAIVSAG